MGRADRLYFHVCCFVLFFMAASASFYGYYTAWHFREAGAAGHWPDIGINQMLEGTSPRPYIYRQLLPLAANETDRILPQSIKNRLIHNKQSHVDLEYNSPLTYSSTYLVRYYCVYYLCFLFALGSAYVLYWLCRSYGIGVAGSLLTPVILLLLFPYFLNWGAYYYDYPELFFFALSLLLARRRHWLWLLPVVVLATFNKESYLFFIPALWPILAERGSWKKALAPTFLLGLAGTAVYFYLHRYFAHNGGGTVELHWREHLDMLLHPWRLILRVDSIYGIYTPSSFSLPSFALMGWTVWRAWPRFPASLRRHAQIAALLNLPLFFIFCALYETRDLSLLYMVLVIAIAMNVDAILKKPAAELAA